MTAEPDERQLKTLLKNFPKEKFTGVGGLALLCGATLYSFSGDPSMALMGSVGTNVLASVLQQHFEKVRDLPTEDDTERLAAFAKSLTPDIRRNTELRIAVGDFLKSYRAFDIAEALVQENPQVHGWLLTRIYSDVQSYRHDFDRIHANLAQMMARLEQLNLGDDDEALRPYLEMIARRSERLPLSPLDPAGGERVDIGLEDVFVSLKVAEDLHVALADEWHTSTEKSALAWLLDSEAALAHIDHSEHVVLLGDAGSGKSTLLRYLAHCLAMARLESEPEWFSMLQWETVQSRPRNDSSNLAEGDKRFRFPEGDENESRVVSHTWHKSLVPVLIELREFARTAFDPQSSHAIWRYVEDTLATEEMAEVVLPLKRKAQRGELFFMLDGVDEVDSDRRAAVWQAIAALREGPYGGNKWIATCRILSYVADEAPPQSRVATLKPLDQEQIDLFVEKWTRALLERGELNTDEAKTFEDNLREATRGRLQELAPNPMLLTIIVLVQKYHGTLPRERALLYDACVETMLLRWQHHKEKAKGRQTLTILNQLGIEAGDLEKMLWEIAWQAHSKNPDAPGPADIPQTDLLRVLQQPKYFGADLVRAGKFIHYTRDRAHLLMFKGAKAEPIYTFPHRTFQEFLAARYLLTNRRERRRVDRLAAAGSSWREVLNLAVGFLLYKLKDEEAAIELIEPIVLDELPAEPTPADWHRVWLAGEMAANVGADLLLADEIGADYLPRLQSQLAALLQAGALTPPQRAEAGTALSALGETREEVACRVPFLVDVPAGPFLMGSEKQSDPEAWDDETPQHEVVTGAYRIGKYPVTNAQFDLFVQAGGYENDAYWTKAGWAQREKEGWTRSRYSDNLNFNQANQPVVGVSWYEAVAYCHWLRQTTGRAFRLPDEAMWEKAARGANGRIYPWGDEWDAAKLNAAETKINRPSAVGIFPAGASPYGALDMVGNVLEWCSTAWGKYPFQPRPYQSEIEEQGARVWRGGAFGSSLRSTRAAFRDDFYPDDWGSLVGFRVAEHLSDPAS